MMMKKLKIAVVLPLAITLFGCTQSSNTDDVYISKNIKMYDTARLEKLAASQKLDLNSRMESLRSLKQAFKSTYVGYDIKKKMIGMSGDEVFESCFRSEELVTEASSNHDFYERTLKCLAQFQDTHLTLQKSARSARVLTAIAEGIILRNKFYISSLRPSLMEKLIELGQLKEADKKFLSTGTEIVSIDQIPALVYIKRIEEYLSMSGASGRRAMAAQLVFQRPFHYPTQAKAQLSLRNAKGETAQIEIPWVMLNPMGDMLETPLQLMKANVLHIDDVGEQSLLRQEGFDQSDDLPYETETEALYQLNNSQVLSLKTLKIPSQASSVCYLKLNTFMIARANTGVYIVGNQMGMPTDLIGEMTGFLAMCNKENKKLIVDLRHNPGGDSLLALQVTTLLEKADTLVAYAHLHRMSAGTTSLILNGTDTLEQSGVLWSLRREAVLAAAESKSTLTPWMIMMNKKNQREVFKNKFVVLTGPHCVSACESSVQRFRMNANAKIIGTSTNGTGFGFVGIGTTSNAWTDPNQLLGIKIPNQAFTNSNQAVKAVYEDEGMAGGLIETSGLAFTENRPVTPHLIYEMSLNDVPDFKDYKKVIEQNL